MDVVPPRNSSPLRAVQIAVLEVSLPRANRMFDLRSKVIVALAGAGLLFQNVVLVSSIHAMLALLFRSLFNKANTSAALEIQRREKLSIPMNHRSWPTIFGFDKSSMLR